MNDIIIAIIGSGALSAIVSGLVSMLNEKRKRKSGLEKAVQLLLLGEIKRQGVAHIKDGRIDIEDLNAFNEMYATYKAMDGNGYAETVHTKVNALPIEVETNGK